MSRASLRRVGLPPPVMPVGWSPGGRVTPCSTRGDRHWGGRLTEEPSTHVLSFKLLLLVCIVHHKYTSPICPL